MFKSYSFIASNENGKIIIEDDDFSEIVYPTMKDGALGGLNYMLYNIVKCYEKRNLNVSAAIVGYFNYLPKNISINEWLNIIKRETFDKKLYNYVFDKYGKDVEKYLILI
jgi:hypothetical protein